MERNNFKGNLNVRWQDGGSFDSEKNADNHSFKRRPSLRPGPTRLQTSLKREASEKLDGRRALGRRLARLCTPCGGCPPKACAACGAPCGGGQPLFQRARPPRVDESLPAAGEHLPSAGVERALRNGGELLNDLLAKKWPYISRWFGQTMKESLEPVLKKYVSEYVELLTCSLGEQPLSLEHVSTSLQEQDWQGEVHDRTNVVVVGELEYIGNGEIEVRVGSDRVGRVGLTNLKIAGRLVIELVKLTDSPPWFGGLRVYFPDVPYVDLTVRSEVFKLPILAMQVKSIVIQQLMNTIKHYAVLPNRFALTLGNGFDPFQMRHPLPQGVLRIEVMRHMGKPSEESKKSEEEAGRPAEAGAPKEEGAEGSAATKAAAGRAGWTWFGSSLLGSSAKSLDSEAEISVGTVSSRCASEECRDFLLYDWERQLVSFKVTGSVEGSASTNVMTLVAGQGPEEPAGAVGAVGAVASQLTKGANRLRRQSVMEDGLAATSVQQGAAGSGPVQCGPSETKLSLEAQAGRAAGILHLRAQWRPLPAAKEVSEALTLSPSLSSWSFGVAGQATWLLLVDLYYATSLPYAELGTEHWAKVTVRKRGASEILAEEESPCASAASPSHHGLQLLRNSLGGSFPAGAEEALQGAVSQQAWRKMLGRGDEAPSDASRKEEQKLVDAVWEHPFHLLLDSGDQQPLIEAIRQTELEIAVWRPEKGLHRAKSKSGRLLGANRLSLASLLSEDGYGKDAALPLRSDGRATGSRVRVRVQVRPLLLPPDFAGSQRWNQLMQGAQVLADRVRTNIRALVTGRPQGGEDNAQTTPAEEEPRAGDGATTSAPEPASSLRWTFWGRGGAAPAAAAPEAREAAASPGYARGLYRWAFGAPAARGATAATEEEKSEDVPKASCAPPVALSEAVRKDLEAARQRSDRSLDDVVGEASSSAARSPARPGPGLLQADASSAAVYHSMREGP